MLIVIAIAAWSPAAIAADAKTDDEKPKAAQTDASSSAPPKSEKQPKRVVGETAFINEVATGLEFLARIDTGATTCSIHAEEVVVEEGKDDMKENVGANISFYVVNSKGNREHVQTTIADTVRVKTSDNTERRYKVWLTLRYGDVERRVHVTINDRSHMDHPLLIGRNFLRGRFLVDVEQKRTRAAAPDPSDTAG